MSAGMERVLVYGASGYTGGELLRLLLFHAGVTIAQATSESHAGEYIHQQHPNLRKRSQLQFVSQAALQPCDVLFLCLPHGEASKQIEKYAALVGDAGKIIDLSADFRLRDPAVYQKYYGEPHGAPAWLDKFVYGLPEINREALRGAQHDRRAGGKGEDVG
jgi:N-acetyl-gamma-glutamyl-phosphate/LysW-gamma-L-alpha-aminoadipyl-6-phosphate reductase